MKHDLFDLLSSDLTPIDRLWRVVFIAAIVAPMLVLMLTYFDVL